MPNAHGSTVAPSEVIDALHHRMVTAILGTDPVGLGQALADGGDPNLRLPAAPDGAGTATVSLLEWTWGHRVRNPAQNVAMVTVLLEHGADPNVGDVWPTVCFGTVDDLVLPFLAAGARVDDASTDHPLYKLYERRSEPLRHPEWVDAMIARGMDVNATVEDDPLLVQPAFAWDATVVQRLIQAGADPCIDGQHVIAWMQDRLDLAEPDQVACVQAMQAWWVTHEQGLLRQVSASAPQEAPGLSRPRL